MSENHGYGPYTNGCRCEICRKAKAAYSARARAAGRENARAGRYPSGVTHGSRSAYEERGCRCEKCCARQLARHRADAKRRQESKSAKGAVA